MQKNPVFKVGDLVVYINDDMAEPGWEFWNREHLPVGCPARIVAEDAGGWTIARTDMEGERIDTHGWFALPNDIHPLYDEP